MGVHESLIRQAVIDFAVADDGYKSGSNRARLWASDLGKCPRRAMYRVRGEKQNLEHPMRLLEAFKDGIAFEWATEQALKHVYGDKLELQVKMSNHTWSGKPDFFINDDNIAMIFEHKATGGKWFDFRQNLPKVEHVLQLCLYDYLYKLESDKQTELRLYYRGWGNYAEFVIEPMDTHIIISGVVNDEPREKILNVDFRKLRGEYETYYSKNELPPKLKDKESGCTFKGKPSCGFYDLCWGDEIPF